MASFSTPSLSSARWESMSSSVWEMTSSMSLASLVWAKVSWKALSSISFSIFVSFSLLDYFCVRGRGGVD